MPVGFNLLLSAIGLDLGGVRLLRQQEKSAPGRSPYELWRDRRNVFEEYQARQATGNRVRFGTAGHWASFVATPDSETLFVGIYRVEGYRFLNVDAPKLHIEGVDPAGTCDTYALSLSEHHHDLIGRLIVDWGPGYRSWVQRADSQDKAVVEIRRSFNESEFPGYQRFVERLSSIVSLPKGWVQALRAGRGVYMLTCPKTREQYVGSAHGEEGFHGRWLEYAETGHGSNVALKSREPRDYRVSILEVAGSAASVEDVLTMEALWKTKLQSREMGLNRN